MLVYGASEMRKMSEENAPLKTKERAAETLKKAMRSIFIAAKNGRTSTILVLDRLAWDNNEVARLVKEECQALGYRVGYDKVFRFLEFSW